MVDVARLQIQINSDGVRAAGRKLDDLARKGTQVGKTLTTRLTLPLVAGMGAAVREAAMLEGAMDKFTVVFGDLSDEMEGFIGEFNKEFPIARRNAIQAAASMQDLLVPMGIAREEATGMTKDWLELAGALSAFNDVPMEQALEAIRSGIAGQSRPLREFGIDARETVLQQRALEAGLIDAGEAMNEQVRQQALLIQSYKQSQDAINGLEEQKGSLLWQMEELKRDSQDLLAIWGQDLIPITRDLISGVRGITSSFAGLDDDTRRLVIQAGLLAAALGPATLGISWAVRILTPLVITLRREFMLLSAAMAANPFMAVATGVVALGAYVQVTESRIRSLNREIDNIMGGGADSIDQVNQAIVDLEDRIQRSSRALSSMMDDPESSKTIREMREQLQGLIDIRDRLALDEMGELIPPQATENIDKVTKSVMELRREMGNLVEYRMPEDTIIDPMEESRIRAATQELYGMQHTLDELVSSAEDYLDVSDRMFEPGSIGFAEQAIANLEQQMLSTTDQAQRMFLTEQIEAYRKHLKEMRGDFSSLEDEVQKTNKTARDLGFTFSSAFEDAIVSGNSFREVLDGIFKDLLRISTRALITEPLGNALSGAISGSFGGGGATTSVDDALIRSDGSIVKFHPDDNILAMKDFSPVVNGGGSKVNVNVNVVNNSSGAEVDMQHRQKPNGDLELVAIVRDINKNLHNTGQMDRTMRNNYGISRNAVRR